MIPLLLWMGVAFAGSPDAAAPDATAVTASMVVKVDDRDAAAAELVAFAQARGGWFAEMTPNRVSLRLPGGSVDDVVALVDGQGVVVSRSVASADLRAEIADLAARKEARESILDRYFQLLTTAGPDAVVSVEQEIIRIVRDIESLSGRLRVLEAQVAMARVEVSFEFRDRTAPARGGFTLFPWVGTLDMVGVLDAFTWSARPAGPTRRVSAPTPEGFSAYKKQNYGTMRAASPDGVMYRVRAVPHKPEATVAFWQEAVRERMQGAGYELLEQGLFDSAAGPGFVMRFAAPYGPLDFSYDIAVVPVSGRIYIAEAVGEVGAVAARSAAIRAAMEGVGR
jgi:hypothetical protein